MLLCPGDEVDKADVLFDIMMGGGLMLETYDYNKRDKDKITWKNPRLIYTVRTLIYFSEVYPKKYVKAFDTDLDDDEFNKACM